MYGPPTLPNPGKLWRDRFVLEKSVQGGGDTCHSTVVVIVGIGGSSNEGLAVVSFEPGREAFELLGWNAMLLHARNPGGSVRKAVLVSRKTGSIFGFQEKTLSQVPGRHLMISFVRPTC